MLGAPDLDVIKHRLRNVHFEPWGPDGVRYVCVLFWDELGFRLLRNHVSADTWDGWHESSGQFWDLFLAGCYRYESAWAYGERALELAKADQPFYWSRRMTEGLAQIMSESASNAGAIKPWSFTGPLELVTVGARRKDADLEIEWESLRAINVDAIQLTEAVSYYTESHVNDRSMAGRLCR